MRHVSAIDRSTRNTFALGFFSAFFNSSVSRIHRAPSIVRPLHNGWESTEAWANSNQLERK
jgi:hypothetical protein